MPGETPTFDNPSAAEPVPQDELIPIGEVVQGELPVLTDEIDTSEHVANFADSYLPEGVADLTGHGFAEAPPKDDEAIPGLEVTELFDTNAYDKAVQESVTKTFDTGDLALVPKEGEVAAQELDAQGSAMQHLIDETPEAPSMGNVLNRPRINDEGYKLHNEAAPVTAEALKTKMDGVLENTAALPQELALVPMEELKAEAGMAAEAITQLSPEQQEKVKWSLDNWGYKTEQIKNAALGKAFAFVSKKFGNEGLASTKGAKGVTGRFLAALADTFKERNEDLDNRMKTIEQTREEKGTTTKTQKLGHMMQVTGGILKWGRMIKEAGSWTVAAPLRIGQIVATAAETGTRVAKEARLKNEEVIDQTRISEENLTEEERELAWESYKKDNPDLVVEDTPDARKAARAMACHEYTVNKAADEAWEIYDRAEKKHALDPKSAGKAGGVSSDELKKAYSEGLPADILKRLEEHPVPGDANNIMQRIFRKHLEVEAGQMQRKLEAIDADPNLDAAAKEKAKERYMDNWGNGKTLKDFDRMLTQQGAVDTIAMSMRYATGAAKVASIALMGGSLKMVWDKLADTLSGSSALPEMAAAAGAGSTMPEGGDVGQSFMEQAGFSPTETLVPTSMEFHGDGTLAHDWAETATGLNVSPEDIATAEHDATWTEGPTGLRMTEEDAITAEMGDTSMEAMGTYAVKPGDTMTAILRGKFPGITDTQIENLRSQDLTQFGITSGNLDKIGLKDNLDMDKFAEALRTGSRPYIPHPGLDAEGTLIQHPGLDAEGTLMQHPGLDAEGTLMQHPGLDAEGTLPQSVVIPSAEDADLAAMDPSGVGLAHEVEASVVEAAHFPPMPSMDINEGVADAVNGLDLPPDYVFPGESLGLQEVHPGDTMTSILRGKFPGITDTQIENLRSQDLTQFGITSGNLDRIGLDDKLDMDKFAAAIKAGRGAGGAVHAAMTAGATVAEPSGGITETVEAFPNTAIPPAVEGAEDAELVSAGEDEFDRAHAIFETQHAQALAETEAFDRAQAEAARAGGSNVSPAANARIHEFLRNGEAAPVGMPVNPNAGIEAGAMLMRPETMNPAQVALYRDAIESYRQQNGGKFPNNVTLSDLITRQIMVGPRAPVVPNPIQEHINDAMRRAQERPADNPMPTSMPPGFTGTTVPSSSDGLIRGSRVYSGSLPNANPRVDAIKEAAERLGRSAPAGSAVGNAATQLGNILGRRK